MILLLALIFYIKYVTAQTFGQTYQVGFKFDFSFIIFEQDISTIDLFGNKQPIFNYMPNPGHVDPTLLDQRERWMDPREEEGMR